MATTSARSEADEAAFREFRRQMVQATGTEAALPLDDQGLQSALADISASCEEFEQFFGSLFDRFENWAGDLQRRHMELTAQAASGDRAAQGPSAQPAECLKCQAKWKALLEQVQQTWSETADSWRKEVEQLRSAWRKEIEQFRDAVSKEHSLRNQWQAATAAAEHQTEQLATAVQQAAELPGQWESLREDWNELKQQWTALQEQLDQPQLVPDYDDQLAALRHQLELAAGERAALEGQLKTAGEHTAELAAEVTECRREVAAAQHQWNRQMGQVRQLLQCIADTMAALVANANAPPEPAPAADRGAADQVDEATIADGDEVLGSLAAQFQMLRRDAARRRNSSPGH